MKTTDDQTSPCRAGPCVRADNPRRSGPDTRSGPTSGHRAGFTLIEMIGVLAVMAILATVLVPNVIRSIDLASIKAEAESLHHMGDQIKTYRRDTGDLPGQGAGGPWYTELAVYSDLSSAALQTNSRRNDRVLFLESPANTPRVILLSSMRPGLALPAVLGAFQTVWDTLDDQVPAGWPIAWANQGQYLVIERVNLRAYLPNLKLVLNNNSVTAVTVSARIMHADGTTTPPIVVIPGTPISSPPFASAGETINFYLNNTGTGPVDYVHVMNSSPVSFNYDDAKGWFPP
jgi:prepilin-type N-terminal cleavage/methylation domain-containing protein